MNVPICSALSMYTEPVSTLSSHAFEVCDYLYVRCMFEHMPACFTSCFSRCHWVPPPLWPPGCYRPGSRGWHRSKAGWRSHRTAGGRTWPTPGWWGEASGRWDHPWPESPQLWRWSGPEGEQFFVVVKWMSFCMCWETYYDTAAPFSPQLKKQCYCHCCRTSGIPAWPI